MTAELFAITGLGCLFPEADSPQAFWENLLAGRDATSFATDEQMGVDPGLLFHADRGRRDRYSSMRGGFVRGFRLDPAGLMLDQARLEGLDPVFTWALHAARAALTDSSYGGDGDDAAPRGPRARQPLLPHPLVTRAAGAAVRAGSRVRADVTPRRGGRPDRAHRRPSIPREPARRRQACDRHGRGSRSRWPAFCDRRRLRLFALRRQARLRPARERRSRPDVGGRSEPGRPPLHPDGLLDLPGLSGARREQPPARLALGRARGRRRRGVRGAPTVRRRRPGRRRRVRRDQGHRALERRQRKAPPRSESRRTANGDGARLQGSGRRPRRASLTSSATRQEPRSATPPSWTAWKRCSGGRAARRR